MAYQDIGGIMKRGHGIGLCLIVLVCWASAVFGATDAGSEQRKPLTIDEMHKLSSMALLMRSNMTAEEDYQACLIAVDRTELVEAMEMCERSAKKGHTGAMTEYGDLLNRAGFIQDAAASYRKAADLGDPEAQYDMGAMYLDLGNYNWKSLDSKVNMNEARKWMLMAAEQDYEDAVKVVSEAYSRGGLGLTDADRKGPEVLKWLHKAADLGSGTAMDDLAEAYRQGKYGLKVDLKMADDWAAKARIAYGQKVQPKKKVRKQRL